jgi:predicted peptidase
MHPALFVLLALETAAVDQSPAPAAAYQVRNYSYASADGKTQTVPYRLLTPARIEPNKRYPLVIFLHGAGERGSDNLAQLKYFPQWMAAAEMRTKYPCFLLAPQCPANEKWVDSPWDKKHSQPLPKEPSESMKQVIGMMDELLKSEPIDTHRVYLTGLSMGGYGSWDLAERMPERFAAVAPLCGGGDDTKVDRLVGIPIWAFHGDADPAVPVERSREMIAALKKAGGQPKYTELPGVGHDCWTTAYKDSTGLIAWMFEQVKK